MPTCRDADQILAAGYKPHGAQADLMMLCTSSKQTHCCVSIKAVCPLRFGDLLRPDLKCDIARLRRHIPHYERCAEPDEGG